MRGLAEKDDSRRPQKTTRPFSYLQIFRASPADRHRMINAGVPAAKAKRMIVDLHFDQQVFFKALNLKTATVNRKAARNETLSSDGGEKVIGIAKLVGQIEAMVEESGEPHGFDATEWLSQWLREPLPAFGGAKPIDYLGTMEGQSLVSHALAQMQSGAYA